MQYNMKSYIMIVYHSILRAVRVLCKAASVLLNLVTPPRPPKEPPADAQVRIPNDFYTYYIYGI